MTSFGIINGLIGIFATVFSTAAEEAFVSPLASPAAVINNAAPGAAGAPPPSGRSKGNNASIAPSDGSAFIGFTANDNRPNLVMVSTDTDDNGSPDNSAHLALSKKRHFTMTSGAVVDSGIDGLNAATAPQSAVEPSLSRLSANLFKSSNVLANTCTALQPSAVDILAENTSTTQDVIQRLSDDVFAMKQQLCKVKDDINYLLQAQLTTQTQLETVLQLLSSPRAR
jgi:hypothetical protein